MSRRNRNGGLGAEAVETLEQRRLLSAVAMEVFGASAPAVFVQNRGQWSDGQVRYGYQSQGAAVAFTDTGVLFRLSQGQDASSMQSVKFSASFVGASPTRPVGAQQAAGLFNYHVGDVSQHRSNVPGFEQMLYPNLYSGVDLHTYGKQGQLKYEFHVDPGADYRQVQIRYSGIEGLSIAADGSLHIQTALGEMVDSAPVLYQEINGQRREVTGEFVLLDGNTYGFQVTGQWDSRYELVLDPDLEWSTYLGGSGSGEYGHSVVVDGEGNVLVIGETGSAGWTSGGFDTTENGGWDVFVVKLSASGDHLWSTYLGGSGTDSHSDFALDSAGNIVIAGFTKSADWVSGGYDTTYNLNGDGFVAKLSSSGEPLWSTYVGGGSQDQAHGVTVDAAGNIIISGWTDSSGWVSGGYDTSYGGGTDAFVAKLSPSGDHLWSSYLGGSDIDQGYSVAADASGNILVTGLSSSSGWTNGGWDAFLVKLSPTGAHLWSTHVGGSSGELAHDLVVDGSGNAFLVGLTGSAGWVSGGYDTSFGGAQDAFVAGVSSSGQSLWSSYLGGSDNDFAYGVALDRLGNVLVTGGTDSSGWVSGGFDTEYGGGRDVFVAKLTASGQHVWSSYLGGTAGDWGDGIAVDSLGDILVTGGTDSSDWVSDGYDTSLSGGGDGFLAKILVSGVMLSPRSIAENQPVGTAVGALSMEEANPADTFGYTLVAGPGDADNASFTIVGDQLYSAAVFDYEARRSYSIRVHSTGSNGSNFERAFTIRITDVNEVPTALELSNRSLGEVRPVGTVVGALSTEDEDAEERFVYTLVAGTGAEDNARFVVVGNELRVAGSLERIGSGSCSVRVRSTDSGGLWIEEVFVISVPVLPPEAALVDRPQIVWTSLGHRSADLTLRLVSYAAPLDLASIDGDELIVSGPAGAVSLTLLSVAAAADGYSAEVSYRLAAPGGRWDQADNGAYSLSVPVGSFADTQGHQNRAKDLGGMGATLPGPLDVQVRGTAYADVLSVTLTNSEYVVGINGIGLVYDASLVRSIRVFGYGGNDRITITGASYICEVSAGAGNDTITGGSGDDLIRGDEDNDVITGNGGEDTLYGNFGNDSITGGEGADSLMGGLGADTLKGGLMGDFLYGGDQMDWIEGEEGDDYIEGRGKADTIYGGAGDDTIYGGAGSDWISAQAGDDWIWVGVHLAFADTVDGGAGNDSSDGDGNDVLMSVENVLG